MKYYKATTRDGDYTACSYSSVDIFGRVYKQIDYNYENKRKIVEDEYVWVLNRFYAHGWQVEEITEEEFFIHCI